MTLTVPPTLMELFQNHKGRVVHKYPHHIEIYDRLFSKLRDLPELSILEIGLADGGSLELWRDYFGNDANIIGVDIQDKKYMEKDTGAQIFTGDQGDNSFWETVKARIGRPNIIIDDGSHKCEHQKKTMMNLFPILQDGGLYIIEDIHTSYREEYGGGGSSSMISYLEWMIQVIHAHENPGVRFAEEYKHAFGVSFYPSLAIVEKRNPETWGGSTMRPVEKR